MGKIENSVCEALANRLEELLPKMQKRQDISREFIEALREAAQNGDNLEFL
jgi:GMP synthase PP-ATPase subunit